MTVRILPSSDEEAALWRTTLEVAQLFRGWPWVIIGAQAVMLLAHERGRPAGRTTGDIDVVLDIRVVVGGARAAAGRLVEAGFEPSAEHPHRFVRGTEQVDLLAPDHLGPNADLTTVPPQTTSEIPGGTRALATRHELEIDVVGVGTGTVPAPSLAGALVIKVRAWQARRAARDLEDIVRLLDLVTDAAAVRDELKVDERRRLGRIAELQDERNSVWRVARDPLDVQAAFARLTTSPANTHDRAPSPPG